MNARTLKLLKVAIDILFVIGLLVGLLTLFLVGVQPFQRGFFCSDESLKYPYKEDTVTFFAASITGVISVIVAILALEGIRTWLISSTKSKLSTYGKAVGWNIAVCVFSMAFNILLVEVLKLSIGRLRPHFFDVCKPDFSAINCSAGYVTQYACAADVEEKKIRDAHKSFPSGHSSFISFTMTYVVLYLQLVLPRNSFRLVRATLQFCAALVAFYVCASRISDYKHHWSDVLSGAFVGTLVAVLTIVYISDLVPRRVLGSLSSSSACTMTATVVEPSYKKTDFEMQASPDIV